ncbi:hypothetical protein MRX96_014599 [Rhipicephalus microplus]
MTLKGNFLFDRQILLKCPAGHTFTRVPQRTDCEGNIRESFFLLTRCLHLTSKNARGVLCEKYADQWQRQCVCGHASIFAYLVQYCGSTPVFTLELSLKDMSRGRSALCFLCPGYGVLREEC